MFTAKLTCSGDTLKTKKERERDKERKREKEKDREDREDRERREKQTQMTKSKVTNAVALEVVQVDQASMG